MSPAVTSPSLFTVSVSLRGSCSAALNLTFFRLSTMSVTSSTTPGKGGEFVLRPGDLDRGDGSAFERGEQDAAQGIADGVAVAGFEGLGDELGVGFSGRALVFDERLRHFKTTVTNWHMLISDCRFSDPE